LSISVLFWIFLSFWRSIQDRNGHFLCAYNCVSLNSTKCLLIKRTKKKSTKRTRVSDNKWIEKLRRKIQINQREKIIYVFDLFLYIFWYRSRNILLKYLKSIILRRTFLSTQHIQQVKDVRRLWQLFRWNK
jgi:hypothetical protein